VYADYMKILIYKEIIYCTSIYFIPYNKIFIGSWLVRTVVKNQCSAKKLINDHMFSKTQQHDLLLVIVNN